MVRFKGSERNKQIAVLFSNTVSVSGEASETNIPCVGPQSLFTAFSKCFPLLARDVKSSATVYADAVSMIEMNKSLLIAGYCIFRKRERIPGNCKRGTRRWKYRRWANPDSRDEMGHLVSKLKELHDLFPETRCVNSDHLIYLLSEIINDTNRSSLYDSAGELSESDPDFNALFTADPQADHCTAAEFTAPLAPSHASRPPFIGCAGCDAAAVGPHGLLDALNSTVLRCFSLVKQLGQHAAGPPPIAHRRRAACPPPFAHGGTHPHSRRKPRSPKAGLATHSYCN
jgi:hypothetical protein